jgi:hypothetical protein
MPNEASELPGAGYDLTNGAVVAELFNRAAEAALTATVRQGCADHLPARGRLIVTGDLHDHGLNLMRICKLAALHASLDHHVLFHEIVHGPNLMNGCDLSVRTLARLAALKVQYPNQVHLVLGNHELAQMNGWAVSKGANNMVEQYDAGVAYLFGDKAGEVVEAQRKFLRSFAMAVRCENRVMCSHSLPTERQLMKFDPTFLERPLGDDSFERGGEVYNMVWGRDHTPIVMEELGEDWDVDLFIIGHEPTDIGYDIINSQLMVVSSDDENGKVLRLDLSKSYNTNNIVDELVGLCEVEV